MKAFQDISAQGKKWTLEDCIITLLQTTSDFRDRGFKKRRQKSIFQIANGYIYPTNFGSDASMQYGRSIDPISNGVTFQQNLRNGYSLSSSIILFNGFTTMNTIAANKFMLKAGLETEK